MKFNYDLLISEIDKHYEASKLEYKIMKFCRDIKIKIYRLKKILNYQAYFQTDEICRILNILDISKNKMNLYFFVEI